MKQFGADVSKVLNIVINSLYKDKDVFVRELISNASDACEKRRFISLQKSEDFSGVINVDVNKDLGILTIKDNGIGMDEKELEDRLGVIGKSGSFEFKQDNKIDIENIIGQFGVGFYSCFMVADKVEVRSSKDGQKSYLWSSNGVDGYSIESADKSEIGTEITLYIKESEKQYLDVFSIEHIVQIHSSNISCDIFLKDADGVNRVINPSSSRIWKKNKNDTTPEEYKAFYESMHTSSQEPFLKLHSKIEGDVEFYSLLFAPAVKPFNLFHPDRMKSVKLYSKGVLIDDAADVLPVYLRFVKGVIDVPDLPLNVSRDSVQASGVLKKIKKIVTNKVLKEISTLQKNQEEYSKFYENYGQVIKEGLCEPEIVDKDTLLDLIQFETTKSNGEKINLAQYVERNPDAKEIIYVAGESVDDLKSLPELEVCNKNNHEVIFLTDSVDYFWPSVTKNYKSKTIKSVKDLNLDTGLDTSKDDTGYEKLFVEVLAKRVAAVKISNKLVDSPACISVAGDGIDVKMERMLFEQKQIQHRRPKILEINPNHEIIKEIAEGLKNKDEKSQKAANVILDLALIASGDIVEKPASFVKDLYSFLKI